jgi:threonine 3-dehydrogenase
MPTAFSARQNVVVLARPEPDAVALVSRQLPPMAADEARLHILCAGICGTDLQIVRWNAWAASAYRPPFALGHEFCAEVADVGANVEHIRRGDRVVAETHLACGHCRQCRINRRHTCENLRVFSRLDRGAFADCAVVPAALLRRVPDGVTPQLASLFEPLGIAVRAAMTGEVAGKNVLVAGCGPIGLLTVAVARAFGAHRIVVSDLVAQRLDLARQLGADVTIDVSHQALRNGVGTHEIDVAFDASGNAEAIAQALACVETGGQLILAGLPDGEVALDLARHVLLREVTIRGLYGRLIDETWLAAERLMTAPGFDLSPLITHRFALTDFAAAFACAKSGQAGKVLFQIADSGSVSSCAPVG